MIEKLLCLDVPIAEEHQKKFQEIRERALELHSKSISFGLVVYEEDRDNSWLKGGVLTQQRGYILLNNIKKLEDSIIEVSNISISPIPDA